MGKTETVNSQTGLSFHVSASRERGHSPLNPSKHQNPKPFTTNALRKLSGLIRLNLDKLFFRSSDQAASTTPLSASHLNRLNIFCNIFRDSLRRRVYE
jgi:hypothetical protein